MCNVWAGDEDQPRIISIQIDQPDPDHISMEKSRKIPLFAYVWNKIYRTEIIRSNEIYFDENVSFNEDYSFNERYSSYCSNCVFIPEPLCVHLYHEEGLTVKGMDAKGQSLSDIDLKSAGKIVRFSRGKSDK